MNIILFGTSFLAGILTIAAPCVLPVLPVIIGSTAGSKNRLKPFIVATSLALSIVVFTLLLKASSLLIDIPQSFWTVISGGIVLVFGFFLLIPESWEQITYRLNLGQRSQATLAKASGRESPGGAILIGAALGPVFSSCSPTYFVILATVLPASFFTGVTYLLVYALGLVIALGLVGYFGQRLVARLGWAVNPKGWFRRTMGLLLILVGLMVITGIEKKIEMALLDAGFGVTGIEKNLLEDAVGEGEERRQPDVDDTKLPLLYRAPELTGLSNWINSEPIASMDELKGKVVLIDFWTYSCINCIRTLPFLQAWHERYADEGLVILGVHAPEFQFEKKIENVRRAVDDLGLTYAVVQDNDFKLWRAYNNHYWPAKYLIDRDGMVRYTHFGEGKYDETESVITELLSTKTKSGDVTAESADFGKIDTPETYIGLRRRSNYVESDRPLRLNEWTLTGEWTEDEEKAVNQAPNAAIKMRFRASKANLVIDGFGTAEVYIDGKPAAEDHGGKDVTGGRLRLNGPRLYELTDFGAEYEEHEIEVRFLTPDVSIFAWTFG